jgi:hypothetical protein
MAKFTLDTADITPEAAKRSLKAAKASFGFLPNLRGNEWTKPAVRPAA